jgi:FKBP-type peptidyl-prolyl cis-trans isomerase FklB
MKIVTKALPVAVALCLGGAAIACAQDEGTAEAPAAASATDKPDTLAERVGYALGHNMGANMQQQGLDMDVEAMIRGLRDGLAGGEPVLSQEEMQAAVQEFQGQMMAKQQEMAAAALEENRAAGASFRETNGAREGVRTTESGMQYEVLTEGTGSIPAASDRVSVHYRGTLVDGEQFDSSYDRGQPATFPVTGVVKGWQEILQIMPVGSKWKVVIPPELAYGERGSPPVIGPGSTLVFEIELLGIEGQGEAAGGGEAAGSGDAEPEAAPDNGG